MKEVRKNFLIPKELMDLYAKVLLELQREFSEDLRFLIQLRVASSSFISEKERMKILKEIKELN